MNHLYENNSDLFSTDNNVPLIQDPAKEGIPIESNLTYKKFYHYYLKRNVPCIIRNIGKDWESSKLWCRDGKPCFEYLKNRYGESLITAYHCNEKYFDSHKTSTMKFKKYVRYWQKYSSAEDKKGMDLLYLKDWHLKNENEADNFYEVPGHFSSDWLNEYLVTQDKDDYRFVYMGPAGSW